MLNHISSARLISSISSISYSHFGSCALSYDLDPKRILGNNHLVEPLALISLRGRGY